MSAPAPSAPDIPVVMDASDHVFVLAGRRFRVVANTSSRQDMHILALIERSGAPLLAAGEQQWSPEVAIHLITTAYRNGVLYDLVAAAMVEEGKKWSLESAAEVAQFLGDLTEPEDKNQMQMLLMASLSGFFVRDDAASETSPSSLPAGADESSASS